MNTGRLVRLFRNGRNQAIRIPREFEMDAEEAIIRREDDRLVIEPIRKRGCWPRCRRCALWMRRSPMSTKGCCPWTTWNFEPHGAIPAGHEYPVGPGA